MDHKLIYILNHYSKNSGQHFFHVLHLLETMSNKGVQIALIIEKYDDIPEVNNINITVIPQLQSNKFLRPFELSKLIFQLSSKGFSHIYIRITWVAAIVAIITSFFTNQKTFFWLSSQGGFEKYKDLSFGQHKIKLFFVSYLPFTFIKKKVYRFVTGPESMKDYFVKEGGVSAEKIGILYNDIDLTRFKVLEDYEKEKLKRKLDLDSNKKIIFFAHRFSPVRKTLYYIPYVFEKFFEIIPLNEYIIVMAGGGPEEKEVRSIINKTPFSNCVKFLGNVPNAIIQEYYQIADIFINPTYAEGFPRVLIEAMACGLPLVTTDAGGIKDILGENQKCYMVNKENRDAFVEKLVYLAQNNNEKTILQKENLITVQRFSTEAVADMYINKIFLEKW